jgi:16S rRNA (adenine1518-N6/adenine1519-N6)-dimethyltransferase
MDSHRHKKQLGQHFLHEAGIIDKIVRAIDPKPGERLVEIGPGAGAITKPLLQRHGALTVIEFDRDLIEPLATMGAALGQLDIVHADVLDVDFTELAQGATIRLVGTCPTISPRRSCSTRWTMPRRSATCTSCCRRKWSTAWRLRRAARSTAASA